MRKKKADPVLFVFEGELSAGDWKMISDRVRDYKKPKFYPLPSENSWTEVILGEEGLTEDDLARIVDDWEVK